MTELKTELKSDMTELKTELKSDINKVETKLERLAEIVTGLQITVARMHDRIYDPPAIKRNRRRRSKGQEILVDGENSYMGVPVKNDTEPSPE
jgi:hypothetical protein